MKRGIFFVILSVVIGIAFFSCFKVPAPEVEIIRSTPLGFTVPEFDFVVADTQYAVSPYNPNPEAYVLDFSFQDTTLEGDPWITRLFHYMDFVVVDSIYFVVRNGVESHINGYYVDFYRSTDTGYADSFMFQSPKYTNISMNLRTPSTRQDTIKNIFVGVPIRVREGVKEMYAHSAFDWQTVHAKVTFFGEDNYGDGQEFEVSKSWMLFRSQ